MGPSKDRKKMIFCGKLTKLFIGDPKSKKNIKEPDGVNGCVFCLNRQIVM